MARKYNRDSKGRFASGGSGGSGGTPKARAAVTRSAPKTTTARGRARTAETRARAALRAGGGTRAARSLATAQRARAWYKATGSGTKRSRTKPREKPANGIRRTGGLRRPRPSGNTIKPGPRFGKARNGGLNSDRQIKDAWRAQRRDQVERMRWMARTQARALADRLNGGIDGEIAGITLRSLGSKLGVQQVKRRARRAARLAAAGSKPAARAAQLYDQQLAAMPPGRRSRRKAKNNIRPGPRNANPEKKPKRKPRTPKPPSGKPKPKRKS